MWLLSDRSRLLVVVADTSPLPPMQEPACAASENGRGLVLVEAVSECWGWFRCPAPGQAKAVWAELAAPAP